MFIEMSFLFSLEVIDTLLSLLCLFRDLILLVLLGLIIIFLRILLQLFHLFSILIRFLFCLDKLRD